ncbi:MAG: MBL fold metallo-hydrolase [bacterium]
MNTKFKIVLLILFAFSISGCGLVMIGFKNLGKTIFTSPEELKSKVTEPIKKDVKLSALWIGHSSVLLQIYDKVILVDPVFNNVISGVMTRRQTSALDINTLPKLDMILVSHAHMDHLSISTLSDLEEKFSGASLVFPEGTEEFLPNYDFDFVRMKTGNSSKKNYIGETKIIDSVSVTTVYALHFGGRFGLDSYLWNMPGCTGYIIKYKDVTVFYAGDTAYDEFAYKEIGKKFDIDLAILPIGPCRDCEEVFNYNHIASYGALLVFDDLKAKKMLPVHYGALEYRNDPDYPLSVLQELIEKNDKETSKSSGGKIYKDKIIILDEGEQKIFELLK